MRLKTVRLTAIRNGPKRTIFVSSGIGLLQFVSDCKDSNFCFIYFRFYAKILFLLPKRKNIMLHLLSLEKV